MIRQTKTILVTFAGRRDRMQLLTRYVDAAIQRGLVDEWHVWDFSRNADDARWLRERFPVTQATPNNSLEYFRTRQRLSHHGAPASLSFSVRATNDVHLGLRRFSGAGQSYEIILGGWNNLASAIRTFDDPNALLDAASRDQQQPPIAVCSTPGLLPEFGFTPVTIEIGEAGANVVVAGKPLLQHQALIPDGDFEILYRTGFGSNGDWRFSDFDTVPARLFVVGPEVHYPKDAMFYNRAYQYYNANYDEYNDDIILKCDDDITYFDVDKLEDFITFRQRRDDLFLISANVVNNGVCAHFQQAAGVIPIEDGPFELPPGGLCGSLWSDGAKAEALHDRFLKDPKRFAAQSAEPIAWNERISINFISLLGRDFALIPDIMIDDEHDLCYGVRKRARRQNCIYPPFVASHLSFWRQDATMKVGKILKRYDALANVELSRPLEESARFTSVLKLRQEGKRQRRSTRSSRSEPAALLA